MTDQTGGDGALGAGSSFAGLRIERVLGRGGAGVVYLAHDAELNRRVALKILRASVAADDVRASERFREEALIAARLEHPAIVPVYATGVEQGMAYLSMRYVPGRSLGDLITEDGPMSIQDAVHLLQPIAAALDYAASQGIVHRDVKPGNIVIDEMAEPRRAFLTDFGIAKALEGTRHTQASGWVGTPEYIAPEILRDEAVSTRADQYSLACVLVECVTGIVVFKRSTTAATITSHIADPADLEAIARISEQAAEAIGVALVKRPEDRYASSGEFLRAVEQCAPRASGETPPTIVRPRKHVKKERNNRLLIIGVVAGLGLLLAAAQFIGLGISGSSDSGDGRSTSTLAGGEKTPFVAGGGVNATDVLIIGDDFTETQVLSKRGGSSYRFVDGRDAADAVSDLLALDPNTDGMAVETLAVTDQQDCARKVEGKLDPMPKVSIVVLDSPCVSTVLTTLNERGDSLPPTYVLASGYAEGFDHLESVLAPKAAIEAKIPDEQWAADGMAWQRDRMAVPLSRSMVNVRSSSYQALGAWVGTGSSSPCTGGGDVMWLGGEADELASWYGESNAATLMRQWWFRYDTAGALEVSTVPIRFESVTASNAKTLTGNAASDREFLKLVEEGSSSHCYVLENASRAWGMEWAYRVVTRVSQADSNALFFIVGTRGATNSSLEKYSVREKSAWQALMVDDAVSMVVAFPSADVSSKWWDRWTSLEGKGVKKRPDTRVSEFEWIIKAAALIAAQKPCVSLTDLCRGAEGSRQAFGALSPVAWWGMYPWDATGDGKEDRLWVSYDPTAQNFSGDLAWAWSEGDDLAQPFGLSEYLVPVGANETGD